MKILFVICLIIIVFGFALAIGFAVGLTIGAFIINDEEKKHGRRK